MQVHKPKTIYSQRYRLMVSLMRGERESANVTQEELAERLGRSPSQISKWERCERRIDLGDLDEYLNVVGTDIVEFTARWKRLADDLRSTKVEVKLPEKQRRAGRRILPPN